jgi:predicted RNA-binding Zn-ribbon protein involved in translation (DUF1610 family)
MAKNLEAIECDECTWSGTDISLSDGGRNLRCPQCGGIQFTLTTGGCGNDEDRGTGKSD